MNEEVIGLPYSRPFQEIAVHLLNDFTLQLTRFLYPDPKSAIKIMRICTYNINWANKQNSKPHIKKIEDLLLSTNADIIIVTESVDSLTLPGYNHVYKTNKIPADIIFEEIDYTEYLNGETAIRVAIYSKYEGKHSYPVKDPFTSICNAFKTEMGSITIYATIIGTRFNRKPYASKELDNCIADCISISNLTNDLCIVGDLNTSFIEKEAHYEIKGIKSRRALIDLCETCSIDLTTKNIPQNIDHILLPKSLIVKKKVVINVFIEKNILSDHKGIMIDIDEN